MRLQRYPMLCSAIPFMIIKSKLRIKGICGAQEIIPKYFCKNGSGGNHGFTLIASDEKRGRIGKRRYWQPVHKNMLRHCIQPLQAPHNREPIRFYNPERIYFPMVDNAVGPFNGALLKSVSKKFARIGRKLL